MTRSQAQVQTPNAGRYLIQLCKHFAHKIEVEYDAHNGQANFVFGTCSMRADETQLILQCSGDDETALMRVQDIVHKHLEGFAFREKPTIVWTRQ
ncbi:hypothetical protein FHR70_004205 [Microvirga lupini]|uniref:DUF2218 domain-containing protein n=1 Tax=Microvirga lupini TaxID=420324 RepID=A0A7W4VPT6_9HYPH|nr:DUF2218 domain-containing protein [Microvirga lupini]MBB3021115.1 hypothetical protein [Microvirga lupini]